jgi:hypothetical protein
LLRKSTKDNKEKRVKNARGNIKLSKPRGNRRLRLSARKLSLDRRRLKLKSESSK